MPDHVHAIDDRWRSSCLFASQSSPAHSGQAEPACRSRLLAAADRRSGDRSARSRGTGIRDVVRLWISRDESATGRRRADSHREWVLTAFSLSLSLSLSLFLSPSLSSLSLSLSLSRSFSTRAWPRARTIATIRDLRHGRETKQSSTSDNGAVLVPAVVHRVQQQQCRRQDAAVGLSVSAHGDHGPVNLNHRLFRPVLRSVGREEVLVQHNVELLPAAHRALSLGQISRQRVQPRQHLESARLLRSYWYVRYANSSN